MRIYVVLQKLAHSDHFATKVATKNNSSHPFAHANKTTVKLLSGWHGLALTKGYMKTGDVVRATSIKVEFGGEKVRGSATMKANAGRHIALLVRFARNRWQL